MIWPMHLSPWQEWRTRRRTVEINTPEETIKIKIGGTIDRMDCKEDTSGLWTTKPEEVPRHRANIEQLFIPAEGSLIIFSDIPVRCHHEQKAVAQSSSALLSTSIGQPMKVTRLLIGEPRKPAIPVNNFTFFEDEFRERLQSAGRNIRNGNAFTQTENTKACEYCDFRALCKRWKSALIFLISPILKEITASPFCNLPINIVVESRGELFLFVRKDLAILRLRINYKRKDDIRKHHALSIYHQQLNKSVQKHLCLLFHREIGAIINDLIANIATQ